MFVSISNRYSFKKTTNDKLYLFLILNTLVSHRRLSCYVAQKEFRPEDKWSVHGVNTSFQERFCVVLAQDGE